MARIRTIKPTFWTDEKIVELSPWARLLFIGLWNHSDDEGRMEYSPKRLKMQIFPADSVDVAELSGEIGGKGLVRIYVVDGQQYLQVVKFDKHQKIDKRSSSKLPPPPPIPSESRSIPTKPAAAPALAPTEGNGEEGNSERKGETQGPGNPAPKPKAGGTPEDEALARRMFDAIKVVAPSAKEPNWNGWANAIRLMREQDARTHADIEAMFTWANRDSFWRSNILSPATLRDKWTQLEAKRGVKAAPAAPADLKKGVGTDGQF